MTPLDDRTRPQPCIDAPKQPLVERVARALADCDGVRWVELNYVQIETYTRKAETALDACHAEEMMETLAQSALELETASELVAGDGLTGTASIFLDEAKRNRLLLASLDGKPSGGAAQPVAPATNQPDKPSNTDKAIAEVAREMARRDREQYPDATVMPSQSYYAMKASEVIFLVLPHIRLYLACSEWESSFQPFNARALTSKVLDLYGMIDTEQMYRTVKAMRALNMSAISEIEGDQP